MKRVLLIAPYPYLPSFSGGQKHISLLTEYLGRECQLTVISTAKNDPSLANGYRLLRWLKNPFYRYLDFRLYARICRLIESESFEAIIWEHPYYYWLARAIQKKFKLFTVIHSHNIEYQRFRSTGKWWWPILRPYEGACLRMADLNYFISPADQQSAISEWGLDPRKCDILPLGVTQQAPPTDRSACQEAVRKRHNIPAQARILLFNGLLNYLPNRQALDDLLSHVNPLLQQEKEFEYRLIICGKNLPDSYQQLNAYEKENILFAGFVEDIEIYFKAADVFLNPVLSGGGIKTKMVEAIALGTTVVSTQTGAIGIRLEICGDKLKQAPDQDWKQFAQLVREESARNNPTPEAYYDYYYWGNIIRNLAKRLADQAAR